MSKMTHAELTYQIYKLDWLQTIRFPLIEMKNGNTLAQIRAAVAMANQTARDHNEDFYFASKVFKNADNHNVFVDVKRIY